MAEDLYYFLVTHDITNGMDGRTSIPFGQRGSSRADALAALIVRLGDDFETVRKVQFAGRRGDIADPALRAAKDAAYPEAS